jgi:hypothetical protein
MVVMFDLFKDENNMKSHAIGRMKTSIVAT